MPDPGRRILQATEQDRSRIVEFLRDHFFPYEPLNIALGRPDGPACARMIVALTSLHEGTSLLAVGDGGTLLGVCLTGEATPSTLDREFCCAPTPDDIKLRQLFARIAEANQVWKETGLNRMLDIHVLAVDPKIRREGLGEALVGRATRLAQDRGFPAVSMCCTSLYSARLAEKLRMRRVFTLRYADHLAEDGRPVFAPPHPHDALNCYVLVFSSLK